jgi:hypothetical protein
MFVDAKGICLPELTRLGNSADEPAFLVRRLLGFLGDNSVRTLL